MLRRRVPHAAEDYGDPGFQASILRLWKGFLASDLSHLHFNLRLYKFFTDALGFYEHENVEQFYYHHFADGCEDKYEGSYSVIDYFVKEMTTGCMDYLKPLVNSMANAYEEVKPKLLLKTLEVREIDLQRRLNYLSEEISDLRAQRNELIYQPYIPRRRTPCLEAQHSCPL